MKEVNIYRPALDYSANESYKSLRTNLLFCGEEKKVIAITSCTANEGKSTVSLNLALSLSDSGKKVLLIDADLRKSVLMGRTEVEEQVKGLSHLLSHQETLENVIKARNSNYQNMSEEEKIEANASISKSIPNFSVLAEQYPDLKANQNFLDLSSQLKSVENDIANARKYYNAVVRQYNNKIEMFPSNIVANMFKYSKKTMFAVDDTNQRQNVKVEF